MLILTNPLIFNMALEVLAKGIRKKARKEMALRIRKEEVKLDFHGNMLISYIEKI